MTHACDTLFNLITVATEPGDPDDRHPDRGDLHAAHPRPRARHGELNYVFTAARDLGDEIEFKPGGFISDARAGGAAGRARDAGGDRRDRPVRGARAQAMFGDVSRTHRRAAAAREGIVEVASGYLNPLRRRGGGARRCLASPHARLARRGPALRRPPRRRARAAELHAAGRPTARLAREAALALVREDGPRATRRSCTAKALTDGLHVLRDVRRSASTRSTTRRSRRAARRSSR